MSFTQSRDIPSLAISEANLASFEGDCYVDGKPMSKGYVEREVPHLAGGVGRQLDLPLIPEEEWKERIEEREAKKETNRDLIKRCSLGIDDQDGIPYCWAYGTVDAFHVGMLRSGSKNFYQLSVESVAATIKRGAAVGGWALECAEGIQEYGICEQRLWPKHSLDYQRHRTPEVEENCKKFKLEWYDLTPQRVDPQRSRAEHFTCLLMGLPVAAARMKWRHLTDDVDLVWKGGRAVPVTKNSWTERWGDGGFGLMEGDMIGIDEGLVPILTYSY